jgi:3'-phosphoadenosine 5'-phosphosulfate sulfotransferase (PAPS reductase)/FAD synthetase
MLENQTQYITPLEFKTDEIIEWAINKFGDKLAISCSFGKDSMVIVHKTRKIYPDIKILNAIAMPYTETIEFAKKIIKEWNLNCVQLRPYKGMNFWKCVKKYGLPHIRSSQTGKKSPKCCYYLKEKPIQSYMKEHSLEACLTGMTAAESWNRKQLAMRYDNIKNIPDNMKYGNSKDGVPFCSMRYYAKTWGSWQVHPIMGWTEQDVWDYTKREGVPINPLYHNYDGVYKRTGCVACTAYLGWENKLSKTHPKLFHKLKAIEFERTGQSLLYDYSSDEEDAEE